GEAAAAEGGEAAAEGGEAAAAEGGEAAAEGDDGEDEDDGAEKDDGDAKKTDKKKDPPKADAAPKVDAKGLFQKKCKSCHGDNGNADTKLGKKHEIEDWTKPGWKAKWPQNKVVDIITNGKDGTKMKAFKDKLTAEEIEALAKYSRKLGK
ncbi:MAG: cytochrome c, partial [Myxococcales bacterium]|nr:cytochrome c [Myxococcales bacterium]